MKFESIVKTAAIVLVAVGGVLIVWAVFRKNSAGKISPIKSSQPNHMTNAK